LISPNSAIPSPPRVLCVEEAFQGLQDFIVLGYSPALALLVNMGCCPAHRRRWPRRAEPGSGLVQYSFKIL